MIEAFIEQLRATSWWEVVAVVLGIVYVLLAARSKVACWYAAFAHATISAFLVWDVSLMMATALNIYYVLMAIYGWYQWTQGGHTSVPREIHTWSLQRHLLAISAVSVLALISGLLLSNNTDAAWPFLDSFVTWGAVLTTFMVTRRVLENWLYWIVLDTVSVFLYFERGLILYALLFGIYLILATLGFYSWRKELRGQKTAIAKQVEL